MPASVENYLKLAKNALDSGNRYESETYCNKVLEIDFNNYEAWLLKGKSAGGRKSFYYDRIPEIENYFNKAVENAPVDKQDKVKEEISQATAYVSIALTKLASRFFIDERGLFFGGIEVISNSMEKIEKMVLPFIQKYTVCRSGCEKELALTLQDFVLVSFNSFFTKYKKDNGLNNEGFNLTELFSFVSRCLFILDSVDDIIQSYAENREKNEIVNTATQKKQQLLSQIFHFLIEAIILYIENIEIANLNGDIIISKVNIYSSYYRQYYISETFMSEVNTLITQYRRQTSVFLQNTMFLKISLKRNCRNLNKTSMNG